MYQQKIRQTTRKRKIVHQKRKTQIGGFLNRYNFAYAGRDVVDQAAKVAPSVIKATTSDINNIAKPRIDQIVSQGGK